MTHSRWARLATLTAAAAIVVTGSAMSVVGAVTQRPGVRGSACAGSGPATPSSIPEIEEGKFNVAMVLIGPHDDGGWSQAHYEGLQYVCENVPDTHVAYVELVPEGADSEQVFRSLARKGFDLIIGTSFGYMDPMETVAEEFPDTTFLHLTGYKSNGTNFGNFFGAMEDFKYLAGMLAGSRAKMDGNPKLGYMATFPIPEEVRLGNAIMLGAKQTCPECTMDVRWINTWHDPTARERGRRVAVRRRRPGRVHGRRYARQRHGRRRRRASGRSPTTTPAPASARLLPDGALLDLGTGVRPHRGGGQGRHVHRPATSTSTPTPGPWACTASWTARRPSRASPTCPPRMSRLVKDTLAKMLAGEFDRFDVFTGPINGQRGQRRPGGRRAAGAGRPRPVPARRRRRPVHASACTGGRRHQRGRAHATSTR